jgi:plastocyanin
MRRLIALFCALPFALAACGDDEETPTTGTSSSGGGETLSVTAEEGGAKPFGFSPKTLTAAAGEVTIDLALPADLKAPHAIAVDGNGVDEHGETVQAGGTSTITADLEPGTYTFYCPVGDHRQAGMEGELTVE